MNVFRFAVRSPCVLSRRSLCVRSLPALNKEQVKVTTGLVGLPVNPNARTDAISVHEQLRSAVSSFPVDAPFRISVEKSVDHVLRLLRDTSRTQQQVEEELDIQLEELIEDCKDELSSIPNLAQNAPWDVQEGTKIEVIIK